MLIYPGSQQDMILANEGEIVGESLRRRHIVMNTNQSEAAENNLIYRMGAFVVPIARVEAEEKTKPLQNLERS